MKIATILLLSFFTLVKTFIGEYIFSDVKFLIGISSLILINTFAGALKAWVKGDFDLVLFFKKTISRCGSYAFFVLGISIMVKIRVDDKTADWIQWLDDYLYFGVALCEFWRITRNVNGIHPGLVPPWMMKLFKEGAETGRITKPL